MDADILKGVFVLPVPIVIASPAAVDLAPAPIPPDWIIEGAPQARSKRLATSADGTSSTMAWSCSAGRFKWHYNVDETLHIISGEVFVTDENDQVRRLGPGDMVFFPAGSSSTWHVPREVRKLAFCRHAMPRPCGLALRAWNKLVGILNGTTAAPLEPAAEPDIAPAAGSVTAG